MAKLSDNPITQTDIKEYLSNYSDFSFELRVLKEFVDSGFNCEHGGTYKDPVTSKSREYDIRALMQEGLFRTHLSIECKNLRENFPLVVHCLMRKKNESYNELIYTFKPENESQQIGSFSIPMAMPFADFSYSKKVQNVSLYPKEQFVAKSVSQIGRRQENGEITSNDEEVFDKISQAINSAFDLISEAHYLDTNRNPLFISFICPVLVIPDSSLCQAKYSDDGEQLGEPEQICHISYYIGKEWIVGSKPNLLGYILSHLEIVTYSEIKTFIQTYLGDYKKRCFSVINSGPGFLERLS
jgi:hypothetical protein